MPIGNRLLLPLAMQILFAPLQGHTDHIYRRLHHRFVGCVDEYYTPFLRWEKTGLRNKDLRDMSPDNNEDIPLTVQVIARDRDEFCNLCDAVQQQGWKRIDFNMGCPFPLQTHAGRGSAILSRPDRVEPIFDEMRNRPDVAFSIKMRLGLDAVEHAMDLLPMINASVVRHVVLHPRLGVQQYKGTPDKKAFAQFYDRCAKPLFFNGDLFSVADVESVINDFPRLEGVMLGRGILADPLLPHRLQHKTEKRNPLFVLKQLHDGLFEWASRSLQGDHQILARMRAFWEYAQPAVHHENSLPLQQPSPTLGTHTDLSAHNLSKTFKKIKKATSIVEYREAVVTIFEKW